ncbi:hypothetical protein G647_03510 [Cladophialophora carrionii CBS 160.54]|uniref:DUF7066 domain-containing protein n=1 Tax=Cladophialophora carrionii CBS 160.54 TaxID=1279043 RepID=V9DBR8_9EURO|nr:uncharacterized protein G647_03510 [Cladophialophora carrionii CBS 160.54]ETI24141.1 hypothetical protein G647_03510 [Cladophialophora carrionii CBS 160.54]
MAINWRLRSTVFQLLAAVYAELGEQGFKGRYVSIAQYFGPEASYDAIKSFFAKEVSKAADQLKAQNPSHHGSGRGVPSRCPAGPSRRPPHLYFDDEDISILTQREFEAVEARVGHSLRGPAKRPRVIKASPRPSEGPKVIYAATVVDAPQNERRPSQAARHQPEVTKPSHIGTVLSPSAVQSDTSQPPPEDRGPSRKRRLSELRDSMQPEFDESSRCKTPPQFESFGYVTSHGQYRCALCLSQLPSQEALERHERISQEHLRGLNNAQKVAKGREKLAQVAMPPHAGLDPNPPVSLYPQRVSSLHETSELQQPCVPSNAAPPAGNVRQRTPSDTIQVARHSIGRTVSQSPGDAGKPNPQDESSITVDKGKGKAASTLSPATPLYPPDIRPPPPPPPPQTPSQPSPAAETRPTTARTEIGTLDTPHTFQTAFSALQQLQDLKPKAEGNALPFSATEIAEVLRCSQIMIQLMGHVQREAKAVATSYSATGSFDSGISLGSNPASAQRSSGVDEREAASAAGAETLQGSALPVAAERSDAVPQPISAPGIDVYTGMRRDGGHGESKEKRRRKDTGSDVSFIVLE